MSASCLSRGDHQSATSFTGAQMRHSHWLHMQEDRLQHDVGTMLLDRRCVHFWGKCHTEGFPHKNRYFLTRLTDVAQQLIPHSEALPCKVAPKNPCVSSGSSSSTDRSKRLPEAPNASIKLRRLAICVRSLQCLAVLFALLATVDGSDADRSP